MFKHFKYMELTRHHIIKKTKKMIEDNAEKGQGRFEQISEVVFSSALSLYISYLTETYFARQSENILGWLAKLGVPSKIEALLLFLVGVVLFVLMFLIIRRIYRFSSIKWRNHKYQRACHSPDVSMSKVKELIDDFDNITFDNLLIAYDYVEQVEQGKFGNNKELCTFYFHETIYYLKTSVKKAKEITSEHRREKCLNIFGNTNGIDVFRLFNANRMMINIVDRIRKILNDGTQPIDLYGDLEKVLVHQIKEIEADVTELTKRCNNALNDLKART